MNALNKKTLFTYFKEGGIYVVLLVLLVVLVLLLLLVPLLLPVLLVLVLVLVSVLNLSYFLLWPVPV